MSKKWYVINTNPKCERLVERQLTNATIEVFLPKSSEVRSKQAQPLFPGYLFVNFDYDQVPLGLIRFMHGVRALLCLDGRPMAVDDAMIFYLKSKCREDGIYRPPINFEAGDKVKFLRGPWQDIEGVFTGEISGRDRARILIDTIYLCSKVEVPVDAIVKVS